MWKYLEQRSFPLTESQYMEQLNAVAECLTEWGAASAVRSGIDRAHIKGPGYTGGGGARAVSCLLVCLEAYSARRNMHTDQSIPLLHAVVVCHTVVPLHVACRIG